jgi:hypothetical protein
LSKSQDDTRRYKYSYTFGAAKKEKPPEEMNTEVLEAYISKLLGTNGNSEQTR